MLSPMITADRLVRTACLGLCLLAAAGVQAASVSLKAYPEFLRVDPFGKVVKADRAAEATQTSLRQGRTISLQGPRGGYVSLQLVAEVSGSEGYALEFSLAPRESGIQA